MNNKAYAIGNDKSLVETMTKEQLDEKFMKRYIVKSSFQCVALNDNNEIVRNYGTLQNVPVLFAKTGGMITMFMNVKVEINLSQEFEMEYECTNDYIKLYVKSDESQSIKTVNFIASNYEDFTPYKPISFNEHTLEVEKDENNRFLIRMTENTLLFRLYGGIEGGDYFCSVSFMTNSA